MHQATFQRRYNRSKPAQNRTKIKGVRAKPALESQHQEGTSQVHLPSGSALPAPGFLGDVVNESTTAKAQLITLLGFVVIQSFHGSLRLSGKTRRKRSDRQTRAEGGSCIPRHFWVFWLGSGKRQPEVTAPSAGKVLALRGSRGWRLAWWEPRALQSHPKLLNFLNKERICLSDKATPPPLKSSVPMLNNPPRSSSSTLFLAILSFTNSLLRLEVP